MFQQGKRKAGTADESTKKIKENDPNETDFKMSAYSADTACASESLGKDSGYAEGESVTDSIEQNIDSSLETVDYEMTSQESEMTSQESDMKSISTSTDNSLGLCQQTPNRLKVVLDEYNKQTEKWSDTKRLNMCFKLPDIAIDYFNEKGGSLSLDKYGVHLNIPRGAIRPGPPQQVYICVDPTAPPIDGLEPEEVALSPIIQCGPQGLKFEESIVLSFPHHAVLSDEHSVELVGRLRDDSASAQKWKEFDGNTLVTNRKVIFLVDHFTLFGLVCTPLHGCHKRVRVGAFGDTLEQSAGQYEIRVRMWNDDIATAQDVLGIKEKGNHQSVELPSMDYGFGMGNVVVVISNIQGGWELQNQAEQVINEKLIRTQSWNTVTYPLNQPGTARTSDGLSCEVCIYQAPEHDNPKGKTILHFSVSTKQPVPLQEEKQCNGSCKSKEATVPTFCNNCKETFGAAISRKVHGNIDIAAYGGLLEQAVMDLCEHLDYSYRWIKLVEHMTNKGSTFIEKAKGMKHPTKEVLKVFFENYRGNDKEGETPVEILTRVLKELSLERAAKIIEDSRARTPFQNATVQENMPNRFEQQQPKTNIPLTTDKENQSSL